MVPNRSVPNWLVPNRLVPNRLVPNRLVPINWAPIGWSQSIGPQLVGPQSIGPGLIGPSGQTVPNQFSPHRQMVTKISVPMDKIIWSPWTYGLWRDCKKETHILKQFSFINFEVGPPTLIVSSELQPRLINSFAWPKDSNNSNQVFTFSNLSLLMNKTKTLAQPSKSIRVNVSWIEHNLTRIEKLRNSKRWPSWAIVSVFVLRLKHSKLNRLGSSLWWWHTCSLRWC